MSTAPSTHNGGAERHGTPSSSKDAASVASTLADGAPMIFFDGVCALCDHAVRWIEARDRNKVFLYAPLQGDTARRLLRRETPPPSVSDDANGGGWLRSLVLLDATGEYRYSSAIVRILRHLGGIWSVVGGLLWIVPRPLRDWGYRFVARNRYHWFGKKESCRLPIAEERSRFLD